MQHSTFKFGIYIWLPSAVVLRAASHQNSIWVLETKLQGRVTCHGTQSVWGDETHTTIS